MNDYTQKTVSYYDRINELFDDFTLMAYKNDQVNFRIEPESTKRTFVLTCPNGHVHTYKNTRLTPNTCEKNCWCQKQRPLKRERLRNGLTITQASKLFSINGSNVQVMERKTYTSRDDLAPYFKGYNTPKEIQDQLIREMIRKGQLIEKD